MPDKNTMYRLGTVLFKDANVKSIANIFENPLREIGQIGLANAEGLATALIAGRGRPEDLPLAMLAFAIERMEDPFKLLAMLLQMPARGGLTPAPGLVAVTAKVEHR